MYIQHGKNLVEHHTHYKKLHGFDKTILMNRSEHRILHNKLRKTGKCNIPAKELMCISNKAKGRTNIEENKKYYKNNKEYIKECNKKYNKRNRKTKNLASFTFEKNA